MSSLKGYDKLKFERLFDMESGYVLDFSNRTFGNFILENTKIDIYSDPDCNDSKANRLRSFWITESDHIVGTLLLNLLKHWKTLKEINDIDTTNTEKELYKDCIEIAENLMSDSPIKKIEISTIKKIDHHFIQENIEKCDKKIINKDYSGAVTNARSLTETLLIHIKAELSGKDDKYNGDLNALYKEIGKELNLSINKNDKVNNSLKRIISGLFSIISGIAELGNDLGDRHGKSVNKYSTEKHHAILVVNSAKTFSEFIFSSFEKQNNN